MYPAQIFDLLEKRRRIYTKKEIERRRIRNDIFKSLYLKNDCSGCGMYALLEECVCCDIFFCKNCVDDMGMCHLCLKYVGACNNCNNLWSVNKCVVCDAIICDYCVGDFCKKCGGYYCKNY